MTLMWPSPLQRGRGKAIWMSASADLASDAERDLNDVGAGAMSRGRRSHCRPLFLIILIRVSPYAAERPAGE
jgi:hypothetical protein